VSAVVSTTVNRWAGPAALLGGLLWVPYGVFEMVPPWGADVVYREDVGYSLIVDASLFVAYSLPGALALLLTSLGLLGILARLGPPAGRARAVGRSLAYAALALAALSLAGVGALFDPVFTAARIFGTLALGAAGVLASLGAHRARVGSCWTLALLALDSLGLFLLPLWPLVYSVELLPETGGAALIALFGLGWVGLGTALIRRGQLHSGARQAHVEG
jgi:hypothetical protein